MKSKFTSLSFAEQDKSSTVKFHDDEKNGVTVCRLYDRWNDRYFTAKTKVHDVDQYDKATGRAIAFNKARRKELLNDLAEIEADRAYITECYEDIMNKLDQREGLKHIYLMGVEDELKELMYHESTVSEDAEPVQTTTEALVEELQPEEEMPVEKNVEEKPIEYKLTQFANFTEREL